MSSFVLESRNLSIGYEKTILNDLSFSMKEGQFIPILGPNGIGKTTLIKTIFQLIEKKDGELLLNGRKIETYSRLELARIFSVSLSDFLNTGVMNCFDFVSLGSYVRHDNEADIIDKIFIDLDIVDLKYRVFSSLSDGQKEWVKLARVLAQDTKFIFLDEPMSHLDIAGKVKMMHFLGKLASRERKCIIMSSHDWSTIRKFSSHIFVITEKGELFLTTPEDLIIDKNLNRIYSLDGEDFFEDNQGEISINIPPRFLLKIESEENSPNIEVRRFWLKHALSKIGYVESAKKGEVSLGKVVLNTSSFNYKEKSFSSIEKLIEVIKEELE